MICYSHGKYTNPRTGQAYGCGQCLACRINKQRQWSARIQMEATTSPASFVTLTFSEDNRPGEVRKKDIQNFCKELRRKSNQRFRYFAVGEYGDKHDREHYHLCIFNYITQIEYDSEGHFHDKHIQSAWGKGFTTISDMTPQRASYIAGYTVKKMTDKDDERLDGRNPEFALMSRMPGVGFDAFLKYCTSHAYTKYVSEHPDPEIPRTIRINKKLWPVNYTCRKYAHKHTGIPLTSKVPKQEHPNPDYFEREAISHKCYKMLERRKTHRKSYGTPF